MLPELHCALKPPRRDDVSGSKSLLSNSREYTRPRRSMAIRVVSLNLIDMRRAAIREQVIFARKSPIYRQLSAGQNLRTPLLQ